MEIDVALEKCKVRPYIPNPQRCFRCQRYGHVNRTCKSRQEVCANCGSLDHISSQEHPCPSSPKCVNCQGDHPAFYKGCPKWKTEKKVQEIKVTQAVTFPEARRIAEGLIGNPSYANVAKKPVQQSPPVNNSEQPHTSSGTTREEPRTTTRTTSGPSSSTPTEPRSPKSNPRQTRSTPTGPRSSPRSSPRRKIQLNTSDGSDTIRRPRYQDNFSELFAKINRQDLLEKHETQLTETRKRKTSGQNEDEEISAKVQATETDPYFEDWYNNTAHSEMYSEEDLLPLPPTTTPPEEETTIPTPTTNVDIATSANTAKAAEPTKKNNTPKVNSVTTKDKTSSSSKGMQTKEISQSDKSHRKGTTPKLAKPPRQKDVSQKRNTGRTPLHR